MKITPEILEEAKKLYLEGNSIRETCNVLQNKFGIKITNEILRRKLKRLGLIRSNSVAQIGQKKTFTNKRNHQTL